MTRYNGGKLSGYNPTKICFDCGQRQCAEAENKKLLAQNALLVEGLKQIGSSSRCCEFALGAHEDKDKCHDIYANKADWCDYCVAKDALAAAKKADKSAKGGE